ncbi:hypothetical protein Asi03nite_65170 [Actinoplanes siamensis]|uniref:Uncharacterized protein n=1 Tax=Actinoplanes siamensis TaxID=1223317 RepID=A0A919TNP1_9ACTN|nr:hypothetical protein Asi03nite_65170 [Actinoplanes siamensis]
MLTGAYVHGWREGYATAVASRPATDAEIAAQCRERHTDLMVAPADTRLGHDLVAAGDANLSLNSRGRRGGRRPAPSAAAGRSVRAAVVEQQRRAVAGAGKTGI